MTPSETESVKVNRKGVISIKIREPSTSGYQWQLSRGMKSFEVVSSRLVAPKGTFGGSANRHLTVKIIDDHPDLLELVLLRPWSSSDVKRTKIFKLEYPSYPSSTPR